MINKLAQNDYLQNIFDILNNTPLLNSDYQRGTRAVERLAACLGEYGMQEHENKNKIDKLLEENSILKNKIDKLFEEKR